MESLRIGAWTVHPGLNLLERDNRSVRIEPRAMDMLAVLARHAGSVVSVDELIATVWKGVVVGDGSVYLAIKQLRRALEDPADGQRYIETIAKRGYRLTVPVEVTEATVKPGAAVPEVSAPPTARPAGAQRKTWRWVAASGASVVLLLFLVLTFPRGGMRVPPAISVAVLPFDNLSSEPEQAYFADGVTEDILSALAGLRDLRVVGRTSSFRFRDQDVDLPAIAGKLDVEYVLEGSVRKHGGQVRISAQLSNARSGQQLWSETYTRQLDDVFVIQDEIAASVARALQVKLGVGEVGPAPGMTRDVEAYDAYLRARALGLERSYFDAITHLQRAVALDPDFAAAWSGLSAVYANGARVTPAGEESDDLQRRSAEAFERARALAPEAPFVLLQAGIREVGRGNWIGAAPFYERLPAAHASFGSGDQAWGPRGIFLMYVGRVREAVAALEHARAEDPLAPQLANFLSQAYLARGNVSEALAEIDRGIRLQSPDTPPGWISFWVAMNQDDRHEIERRLRPLRESADIRVGPPRYIELARFLDAPAGAEAEIRRMAASAGPDGKILLSLWAAYFKAPELALELLSSQARDGETMPILWQPIMRDVRKLPGFKELVRTAGLVDYWRAYGWPDFCRPVSDDFACE